jgi:hypothetical protein
VFDNDLITTSGRRSASTFSNAGHPSSHASHPEAVSPPPHRPATPPSATSLPPLILLSSPPLIDKTLSLTLIHGRHRLHRPRPLTVTAVAGPAHKRGRPGRHMRGCTVTPPHDLVESFRFFFGLTNQEFSWMDIFAS